MKNAIRLAAVTDSHKTKGTGATVAKVVNERGTVEQRIIETTDGLGGPKVITLDERVYQIAKRTDAALTKAVADGLKVK